MVAYPPRQIEWAVSGSLPTQTDRVGGECDSLPTQTDRVGGERECAANLSAETN